MKAGPLENVLATRVGELTTEVATFHIAPIPPIHVHIDDDTSVHVHIKKPKNINDNYCMEEGDGTLQYGRFPGVPPPSNKTRSHYPLDEQSVKQRKLAVHELVGDIAMSGQEKAFLKRSLNVLRRDTNNNGERQQGRSAAGQDQTQRLTRLEQDINGTLNQLEAIQNSMRKDGCTTGDAAAQRDCLVQKLNDLESCHTNLKKEMTANGCPVNGSNDLQMRLEQSECKNRELTCELRDHEVAVERLRRQIQCEKDYVASLSRMQTELEETRACLQRELLCKTQEIERSTIQMKNLQSQMSGHIQEVERLQEYVDQTTKKNECEKEGLKKALKCQQERLARAEDGLHKATIRIECMDQENCRIRNEMKKMENELDYLRPEVEAKKQLEEVCQKLQAHLKELQPLPELLKTTELRLQEEQLKHAQSEQRVSEQARLITELTSKIDQQIASLRSMKERVDQMAAENSQLQCKIDNLNCQLRQSQDTVNELNSALHLKNELIAQLNLKLEDKDANTMAINRQLEEALAESQRLSCLVEERSQQLEAQFKSRLKEMEAQLALSKQEVKQLKASKLEMECKYSKQMTDLREKLEQCDMATHNMQSYIAYLKTSYATVFNDPNLAAMCNPMLSNQESGVC